jgi:hypothetical protein
MRGLTRCPSAQIDGRNHGALIVEVDEPVVAQAGEQLHVLAKRDLVLDVDRGDVCVDVVLRVTAIRIGREAVHSRKRVRCRYVG